MKDTELLEFSGPRGRVWDQTVGCSSGESSLAVNALLPSLHSDLEAPFLLSQGT